MSPPESLQAILLDLDGVLYVDDAAVPGAAEALEALRALAPVRLVTNTTSKSRAQVVAHLDRLGLPVEPGDVLTPAALAVRHCRQQRHQRVRLLVPDALREDLAGLDDATSADRVDAIVLGDLGDGFTPALLNAALGWMLEGAELVALQHNRNFRRGDRLVLDVGAWAAALEYASGRAATVVGKPDERFFRAALDAVGAAPASAVMVGDDVEADVGGAMAAGLAGILVRTGKFRDDSLAASGVRPSAIVDSIADVPRRLREGRPEAT